MKTHVSLRTHDIDSSVAFYRTLLQSEPAKHYFDYALFVTEDPGIELALDAASRPVSIESAHYGIVVADTAAVSTAIERFRDAGLELDIESEETCCYAKQTKAWITDPDGRRWEVYTVHEETAVRDGSACCVA